MSNISIKELRRRLQSALDTIECYKDDDKVSLTSNTYFLGNPSTFIGIAGGGYLDLNNIENQIEDENGETVAEKECWRKI